MPQPGRSTHETVEASPAHPVGHLRRPFEGHNDGAALPESRFAPRSIFTVICHQVRHDAHRCRRLTNTRDLALARQLSCCRQNGAAKPDVAGGVSTVSWRGCSGAAAGGFSRYGSTGDRSGIRCAMSWMDLGKLVPLGCRHLGYGTCSNGGRGWPQILRRDTGCIPAGLRRRVAMLRCVVLDGRPTAA